MRTIALSLSLFAGLCCAAGDAGADEVGTFQVLGPAQTEVGVPNIRVVPVGIGPGWRGWSWYPSASRPVAPYYGTANQVYGYSASPVRAFNYYYRHGNGGQTYRH